MRHGRLGPVIEYSMLMPMPKDSLNDIRHGANWVSPGHDHGKVSIAGPLFKVVPSQGTVRTITSLFIDHLVLLQSFWYAPL